MRTHFPGTVHEVRSAARFPLSAAGASIPDAWRAPAKLGGDCANGRARMVLYFTEVFLA
jgi:hypothetical protein